MEINEADFRWQRHILSSEQAAYDATTTAATAATAASATERSPDISISITTETGQTTLDLEVGELGLGHTTPEECGEDARLPSPSSCGVPEETGREPSTGPEQREGEKGGGGGGGAREPEGRADKQRAAGGGGGVVPPDVVQRSHALVYPDITNFLSVESRTRSHHGGGSRYSESNFRCESLIGLSSSC